MCVVNMVFPEWVEKHEKKENEIKKIIADIICTSVNPGGTRIKKIGQGYRRIHRCRYT